MQEGCSEVFSDLKKAEEKMLYRRLCITKFCPPTPPSHNDTREAAEVEGGIQSAL